MAGSSSRATTGAAPTAASSRGPAGLPQRGDVDLAVSGTVELAEEDALPGPERELPVGERHEDLRAHQRGADVGRRVGTVRVLDVLPVPAVVDDLLER